MAAGEALEELRRFQNFASLTVSAAHFWPYESTSATATRTQQSKRFDLQNYVFSHGHFEYLPFLTVGIRCLKENLGIAR